VTRIPSGHVLLLPWKRRASPCCRGAHEFPRTNHVCFSSENPRVMECVVQLSGVDVTSVLSLAQKEWLDQTTVHGTALFTPIKQNTSSPSVFKVIYPSYNITHRENLPAPSSHNFHHHKHLRIPQPHILLSTPSEWPNAKLSRSTIPPTLTQQS